MPSSGAPATREGGPTATQHVAACFRPPWRGVAAVLATMTLLATPTRALSKTGRDPFAGGPASRSAAPASRPGPGPGAPPGKAPTAAASRYVKSTNPAHLQAWGCQLGRNMARRADFRDALVVLDFGKPMRVGDRFGASLFRKSFRDTDHIRWAGQAYVRGFFGCSSASPNAVLELAMGTSNWGAQVGFRHGRAWALMVNQMAAWVQRQGYAGRVAVAGASDIETGFNGPEVSRAWVNGYVSAARGPYFDYGDAGGCPPFASCAGAWTQEDVWYVAAGVPWARALPEIYRPDGLNARQWYQLSLYGVERHGRPIAFAGVMAQGGGCRRAGDPCRGTDNSADRAWQQLQTVISADPRTAQRIRWSTDITG